MKFIDKQGRLFGRVSVIDLLVILVVVVLAAVLCLRKSALEHTSPTSSIVYCLRLSGIRDEMVNCWQVGDQVFDEDSGIVIGVISAIDVQPCEASAPLADGTYVTSTVDGRKDMTLTLSAEGFVSNGRTYVDRTYEINVNSTRTLSTKYADFDCIITEIQS
jgi:hypothetical protein